MKRFAIMLAIALFASSSAEATEEMLFDRLKLLSGPNAIACGTVKLRDSDSAAFECARKALAEGKPFWVAAENQGTDSFLWRGVALEADKKVWLLSYDSNVKGGEGYDAESVEQHLCHNVQFVPGHIRCPP